VRSCGYIEGVDEVRAYVGLSLKKIVKVFCARDKLLEVLIDMFHSEEIYETQYVIENFFEMLPNLDPDHSTRLKHYINRRLHQRDTQIYNALCDLGLNIFDEWDEDWLNGWGAPFKEALLSFKAKKVVDDDLPF